MFQNLFLLVVQSVFFYVVETMVLSMEIYKTLEGFQVVFLHKVTGKTSSWQCDRTWSRATAGIVLKKSGNQTLGTYINRWQKIGAEWVELIPIYVVDNRETGYEGGG